MKDTGKTFKGVKVYTDPNVPPDRIYFTHLDFKNMPPQRSGKLTNIIDPPKKYGFWRRIKWHLWDSL